MHFNLSCPQATGREDGGGLYLSSASVRGEEVYRLSSGPPLQDLYTHHRARLLQGIYSIGFIEDI